jgi:hypothetical protein
MKNHPIDEKSSNLVTLALMLTLHSLTKGNIFSESLEPCAVFQFHFKSRTLEACITKYFQGRIYIHNLCVYLSIYASGIITFFLLKSLRGY